MKKEIIQFFKSKTNVIAMLIFPIVLIFVMGKSLDGLMSMDKNIFSGKIIYFNIEDTSGNKNLQPFYDFSVQFQKDTEAEFIENTNHKEAIEHTLEMKMRKVLKARYLGIYTHNI